MSAGAGAIASPISPERRSGSALAVAGLGQQPIDALFVADDGLDEAVPVTARAALPFPAEEDFAAALTDVSTRGLGHGGQCASTGVRGGLWISWII